MAYHLNILATRPDRTIPGRHATALRFTAAPATSPVETSPPTPPAENTLLTQLKETVKKWIQVAMQALKRAWNALWDKGPMQAPRLLVTDAYNIGSGPFVSKEASTASTYQVILARVAPPWAKDLKADKRLVFFGLQLILDDLLSKPITREEIDEAERFLKTAHVGGKPYKFDRAMWDRVVDEYDGRLPITIEALRDGSVAFVGEPVMQITAKDGFGELASWFEAKLLQVFATSERTTIMRYWLDRNKELVKRCSDPRKPLSEEELNRKAAMMTHDFGDRASSCPQESEWFAMAHLASGHITSSTFAGAYKAWKDANEQHVGGWIKSLAHRIVQGYRKEQDAYKALYNAEPDTVTSHVADCYDFYRATDKYLIPLAKKAKRIAGKDPSVYGVISSRPDSGDMLKQIMHVLVSAVNAGLYKTVIGSDGKPLVGMTHLKVVSADEMNFAKMEQINNILLAAGFSPPDCISYGVGGGLRDAVSRKHFSTKMALAAVGNNYRPVMKFAQVPTKRSIPGRVKIVREGAQPSVRTLEEPGKNEFVLRYTPERGIVNRENFTTIRQRIATEWDQYKEQQPAQLLSHGVLQRQEKLSKTYVSGKRKPHDRTQNYQNLDKLSPVKDGTLNTKLIRQILDDKERSVTDYIEELQPQAAY